MRALRLANVRTVGQKTIFREDALTTKIATSDPSDPIRIPLFFFLFLLLLRNDVFGEGGHAETRRTTHEPKPGLNSSKQRERPGRWIPPIRRPLLRFVPI